MAAPLADRARDVVGIGGVVVGIASAWYLASRGASVTVVEQGEVGAGASYGNAGLVVPSHSVPLPHPGVPSQGLRSSTRDTSSSWTAGATC